MSSKRFTVNPFDELALTAEDREELVGIADTLVLSNFEKYEEYLNDNKHIDIARWKKIANSGATTSYMERKKSNPDAKFPDLIMVGPLPGTLSDNMFGLMSPTLESMRIKTSYLNDFSAAAILATIVEPTVEEPLRSVVVKWMEIDIPGASIGLVRNRDYVYLESTGIMPLKNGEQVGYHLLHSVNFPQTHKLPNRIRGNMSFCAILHQEGPDRTDCCGRGIMDPGGDMIRSVAVMGMVQATMAGVNSHLSMNNQRFTVNPFGELTLTAEDRAKLVEITDEIIIAKFEEYEEHLNIDKLVDLKRWKKFAKSGPTTSVA
ncbi:uncharacterized protein IUM83_12926 [Phytophthora cinnamomi]|uniref:uncharacterized protein n=1 Tax=Phytophthora cinnamomi TaxID=4785 RepID=UPI0035595302|nr:hypothetical protein IUM83_12926 [Phytophthora cinnamomi]